MSAGKGDTPRKVNGDKFRTNYLRIFAEKPKQTNGITAASDCRDDKHQEKASKFARIRR